MKNVLNTTLFGAALLVATAGFAQSSTSPQKGDEDRTPTSSTTSQTTTSTDTNSTGSTYGSTSGSTTGTTGTSGTTGTYGSTAASTAAPRGYTGTVKTLDAGRTLVITMANGKTQTFDISGSPAMDTSVAVGSRVRVKQSVDANGHTVVTVEPYR
ncbi:MAG TPA: hypothetical protein VKH46_01540 [Thermoanaerobaculia bacterium]|jgi:hypothetical protein|nr:hypothetical protein [Thermoanaerobaculia bacterium]